MVGQPPKPNPMTCNAACLTTGLTLHQSCIRENTAERTCVAGYLNPYSLSYTIAAICVA